MISREPFAYVVSIDGSRVALNLRDTHRGHLASHRDGVSSVTETGSLFGVDGATRLLIMRVRSVTFVEPREAHRVGIGSTEVTGEPLRSLDAVVVGAITRQDDEPIFTADSLLSPALGAEAYPLTDRELNSILRPYSAEGRKVQLGSDVRSGGKLAVSLTELLSRHVAILGATGHGKSCFTAAAVQQMLTEPRARIVVFDINGEYEQALKTHASGPNEIEVSCLGGKNPQFRIPYVALGRHGLNRLLLPSEKTQRPALTFALESLKHVRWFPENEGIGLASHKQAVLFDDCRPETNLGAKKAIDNLRAGNASVADKWPHMRALACLVAESHSLQARGGQLERNAFLYGNVAALVNRIRRYTEDPQFTSVISVEGGEGVQKNLDWREEASHLVDRIFGKSNESWKLHIVNLRSVAHDLLPVVLGSLLELLAFERFRRGQEESHPTLLVLEEAHHYLRSTTDGEEGSQSALAYERLAKEGRKFGISLWISTQRPAEVSPTVLAQCGTWVVFRLTSEYDLRSVAAAGEWFDRQELERIAGLPRQQAVIFGNSVAIPVRVIAPNASPLPKSKDPDFSVWSESKSGAAENEDLQDPPYTPCSTALDNDDIPF